MTVQTYIGRLQENPYDLAWRLQHLLPDVSVIVWLNEREELIAAPCGDKIGVPHDSIVGIYMPSQDPHAIEADIDAARKQRRQSG